MNGSGMSDDDDSPAHLSGGGWLALTVLLAFLAGSIWYAVYAWGAIGIAHMSASGWFALVAGSVLTVVVGGGLMALMFYSSRRHYDR